MHVVILRKNVWLPHALIVLRKVNVAISFFLFLDVLMFYVISVKASSND